MILLTGASGFIGNHLLKILIELYGKEKLIALTSKPIQECRYVLHNNYNFDESVFIQKEMKNIDIIIHAGAYIPKIQANLNNITGSKSNIDSTYKRST